MTRATSVVGAPAGVLALVAVGSLLGGCASLAPVSAPGGSDDAQRSQTEHVSRAAAAVVDGLEQRLGANAEPAVRGFVSCAVGGRYAVDVQLHGFAYLDAPRAGHEVAVIDEVLRSAGLDTAPGAAPGGVVGTLDDLRVAVSAPPARRAPGAPREALRTVSASGGCLPP